MTYNVFGGMLNLTQSTSASDGRIHLPGVQTSISAFEVFFYKNALYKLTVVIIITIISLWPAN